ncbi:hypothetical protein [Nocardioides marinquilinus]
MTYIVNETTDDTTAMLPGQNITVEAVDYIEAGSFVKFYDANGDEVYAIKTDSVRNIRTR